jgi:protein phosphatase
MRGLRKEGFHGVYVLNGLEEIEAAVFERERLWNDARDEHGPYDIAGDVHGWFDELCGLLSELSYEVNDTATDAKHVGGRRSSSSATRSTTVRHHPCPVVRGCGG